MKIESSGILSSSFLERIKPAADARASQSSTPDAAPKAAAQASASETGPDALSSDEQHMIARYFPERPEINHRLYGPRNSTSPSTIGGRLDLNA